MRRSFLNCEVSWDLALEFYYYDGECLYSSSSWTFSYLVVLAIVFEWDTKLANPNLLLLPKYSSATSSFILGINSNTIYKPISE